MDKVEGMAKNEGETEYIDDRNAESILEINVRGEN